MPLTVVSPYGAGGANTRVRAHEWLWHLQLDAVRYEHLGAASSAPTTLAGHKHGLSVDMGSAVLRHLAERYRYELDDPGSRLHRWAGSAGAGLVAPRADRSPCLAFRVAMLGVWEQEFDENTVSC